MAAGRTRAGPARGRVGRYVPARRAAKVDPVAIIMRAE